jgi:hypothetical protein
MTDRLGSVNSNNSPVNLNSSQNQLKSTGDAFADAFISNIQNSQSLKDQVKNLEDLAATDIDKQAILHALHDPSSEQRRLEIESQAVINESHLEGLRTAASALTNAPQKMGTFMAVASMPVSWTSPEAALKPQYDSAVAARNTFVEAVRESLVAKFAALAFIPTTLPALWALLGGQTKYDKALAVVSLAQNEFVINGIKDNSISDFSMRVNKGIDFLNGIKLESIKAESNPSLKFVGLLLEQVMNLEEKPHVLEETVTENHIIRARELLNELQAFLTKKPEEIISGVKENGGPSALKAMVQAVSGVPPLLEAKYHAGPKVDSLIKTIGIDEKQAEGHLKTLDGVGSFFKKILGLQVKKAETVLEEARKSSEIISKQAAQQIMTGLAKTVNDPDTRQGIHDVNRDLANLATQFVQTVSNRANEGLTSNLASVNEAIARASKADLN